MITISCPLLSDSGRFLGVLAAELQRDRLRDELAEAEVYRSGYAIAVSEHGLLLGSAKRGDAGKPALDCGYNIPLPGKNEDVIFARLSVDGKSSLAFTLRTELDAGGGTYYVSVAAPVRELNAAAANPISTTAAMLILVGIIMILIVNRRSKFLLRPLAVINAKLLHYKATGSVKGDSGAEEADERLMQGKYESSEALRLLSELFERMGNHGELLKSAAERDLSQDVRVDDVIGRPLRELLMNLNGSFKAFQAAAGHLSALAQQNTAQLGRISQGITTQEAGLQNLAGTSHAMSEQTNETLRSAEAVFSLTESAGRRAANGARHMERIRVSMGDIRGAAAAVTQHIDEITAQSSILALNAAVEAARAGQKGSGLAVVADGIRKLSEKSAETARLTSDMISKSLEIIREADAAWERADAGVRELSSRNELINKRVQDIINSSRSEKSSIESMNEDIKRITRLLSEGAKKASEAERQSREAEARAQELIVEASGYKL
jgi:methyl-accepting chemotaxis protein